MVGDNLSTDIEFGINSGVRTLLVMGGTSSLHLLSPLYIAFLSHPVSSGMLSGLFKSPYMDVKLIANHQPPGVTKREQIFGDQPSPTVPDFVMESFGDFAVLAK